MGYTIYDSNKNKMSIPWTLRSSDFISSVSIFYRLNPKVGSRRLEVRIWFTGREIKYSIYSIDGNYLSVHYCCPIHQIYLCTSTLSTVSSIRGFGLDPFPTLSIEGSSLECPHFSRFSSQSYMSPGLHSLLNCVKSLIF